MELLLEISEKTESKAYTGTEFSGYFVANQQYGRKDKKVTMGNNMYGINKESARRT